MTTLTPLQIMRRSEELDDLEAKIERGELNNKEKIMKLRNLLRRIEHNLP